MSNLSLIKQRRQLRQRLIQSHNPYSWWKYFSYSESILIARVTAFTGFCLAVGTGLDWSALLSLDITKGIKDPTLIYTGCGILMHGVISELARRRNSDL